jgi:cell pole-organizing protein PopZ
MSAGSVTPEPSMEEILQMIDQRINGAPEPDPAPRLQAQLQPPRPPATHIVTGNRILSDGTASAAAAAFAQVAAVRREQRRAAEFLLSSAMTTTLEDVVHELVRPMLGGWLNAKLPEVIDRVVQAEIARMNADATTPPSS